MAKRMQEQKGEERIVAKSRRTAMNLSSHVPTISSSAKSLIASKSPEILTATVELASRMTRNSKSDAASSSQVRLQAAHLGGLMDQATVKLVATEEESGDVDLSESENESEGDVTGKFFVFDFFFEKKRKGYGENPMHPVIQLASEVQKLKRLNGHTVKHVAPATVQQTETIFSIVKGI